MILPWLAVLASGCHVGAVPGDADTNDGQASPLRCFRDTCHEPTLRKLLRADGIDVGSPRSLAPQQHFPATLTDGIAPILAGVDNMASIRENPCETFGYAQDIALGSRKFDADACAAAVQTAGLSPSGVPSANANVGRGHGTLERIYCSTE